MKTKSIPYGLVVRAGTFETYQSKTVTKTSYELSREEAIKVIVRQLAGHDIVVSTTGKISRELFEYREELGQGHNRDFLTIGSMGHSSQIAAAIALSNPGREVYCIDGDGALIMHTGGLATIGLKGPKNFKHIVLNNGAHDSVGGQPTAGFNINIPAIAMACNYKAAFHTDKRTELEEKMQLLKSVEGPALLEVKVAKGARNNLGRPTISPIENKKAFMRFLQDY